METKTGRKREEELYRESYIERGRRREKREREGGREEGMESGRGQEWHMP